MSIGAFLEQAGIPLLLFAICMYYGLRLIIVQDISMIRSKDKEPVKDEKAYAREGGKLILFFGAGTFLMAVLIFVNVYAAVGEIIVCTLVMGVLWKRMNDKYGS
ncbi:MAG: hypothetical protein NC318_09930 [Blautia sp.]|nr:hypothetical protein [Lachnoclostridium sp.]MCM1211910.1 hypothetical protein [Blautia sp.]